MTDDQFLEVAGLILDGTPVSWDTLPKPASEADRGFLKQLRLLDELTRAHHAAQSLLGTRWGPLLIVERIGSGTFGDVYKARDTALDRDVALKLLRSFTAGRHLAEGRLLARVRHPNVVTVHGAAERDGVSGVWMEFIQGRTLAQLVAERGPFAASEVTAIGIDVCRALAAVHASGLLHGDIKAQNVMREDGGRIVLMDFGTGRIAGNAPQAATLAGTPLYIAPEVLNGEPADASSDVYGVGILLYFLLTGTFPIEGRTLDEVRAAHRAGARTPIRERRPDVPRRLAAVVDRATAPAEQQRYQTATDLEAAVAAATRRPLWRRPGAVAASLILVAAVAAGWWRFPVGGLAVRRPPIAFQSRDWVLVAHFENRTGDPAFDDVLEAALARELANSDFVNVVPRVRIEDALQLMRRPVDAKVDRTTAREVCVRDGGIRALVTGRVEKLGSTLVLTAEIVQPSDGQIVAGSTAEAATPAALPMAMRHLSDEVRRILGERREHIKQNDEALERVTTPSLTALRHYTEAFALGNRSQWPAAGDLAERAVSEDPEFASAWIWLAWARWNTGHPDDAVRAASQAMKLADRAVDWERDWIVGSYYFLTNQPDRALAAYEALLRLRPDHFWAVNNLVPLLNRAGRPDDALSYTLRAAALRPRNPLLNWQSANLLVARRDFDRARPYVQNLLAIGPAAREGDDRQGYVWSRLAQAFEPWSKGDLGRALEELEKCRHDVEASPSPEDEMAQGVAFGYLMLGKPSMAARMAVRVQDKELRHLFLAHASFYAGDREAVQAHLRERGDRFWPLAAWLWQKAGRNDQAQHMVRMAKNPMGNFEESTDAQIALDNGDPLKAVSLLEPKLRSDFRATGPRDRAAMILADAYARLGKTDDALNLLVDLHRHRGYMAWSYSAFDPEWLLGELQLAELYRRLGRIPDAIAIEDDLARLLIYAEPDFQPLVQLKRLQRLTHDLPATGSGPSTTGRRSETPSPSTPRTKSGLRARARRRA